MWFSSLEPDFGLMSTIGTPACSAPTTATAVSIRGSAITAIRPAPFSCAANLPAAAASCA